MVKEIFPIFLFYSYWLVELGCVCLNILFTFRSFLSQKCSTFLLSPQLSVRMFAWILFYVLTIFLGINNKLDSFDLKTNLLQYMRRQMDNFDRGYLIITQVSCKLFPESVRAWGYVSLGLSGFHNHMSLFCECFHINKIFTNAANRSKF